MRLSPAVKLGSKMISHQTQPPQEVLCSVSAALLILACGGAVEQSQTQISPAFRTTVSSDEPRHATRSRSGNGSHNGQPPGDTGAADPGPDEMAHM